MHIFLIISDNYITNVSSRPRISIAKKVIDIQCVDDFKVKHGEVSSKELMEMNYPCIEAGDVIEVYKVIHTIYRVIQVVIINVGHIFPRDP
jgi:hypothetical protein